MKSRKYSLMRGGVLASQFGSLCTTATTSVISDATYNLSHKDHTRNVHHSGNRYALFNNTPTSPPLLGFSFRTNIWLGEGISWSTTLSVNHVSVIVTASGEELRITCSRSNALLTMLRKLRHTNVNVESAVWRGEALARLPLPGHFFPIWIISLVCFSFRT